MYERYAAEVMVGEEYGDRRVVHIFDRLSYGKPVARVILAEGALWEAECMIPANDVWANAPTAAWPNGRKVCPWPQEAMPWKTPRHTSLWEAARECVKHLHTDHVRPMM